MRIEVSVDSGIAYFPGRSQPTTIDTKQLPDEEAEELESLFEKADFFNLPSNPPPSKGADYRQYRVSAQRGRQKHTARLVQPNADPDVSALLKQLNQYRGKR